jgi:hypothetical protein
MKNKMVEMCSRCRRHEKHMKSSGQKTWREDIDVCVDELVILKWI